MILVDSSIVIDLLNGRATPHTDWFECNAVVVQMALTDLILYEVLRGVREEKRVPEVQRELQQFTLLSTMTQSLELKAAENYRDLRRKGITLRSSMDCLIATFCIENDHHLLHNDRDFNAFEEHFGLQVIHRELRR